MTKTKTTKRALLTSVLSMMLCMAMLVGSTFAWFTDSVTSGKNKIVAGNLDVELEYATAFDEDGKATAWDTVDSETELFKALEKDGKTANLWEPGHTEVVYLRIRNAGTLALKYQFDVNVYGNAAGTEKEKEYPNANGGKFKLSDYLVFVQDNRDVTKVENRESLWIEDPDAEKAAMGILSGLGKFESSELLPGATQEFTLAVYMPTQVGNEANYRGEKAPEIYLGLSVFATQTPHEEDSFGSDYDANIKLMDTSSLINAPVKLNGDVIVNEKVDLPEAKAVVLTGNGTLILKKGIVAPEIKDPITAANAVPAVLVTGKDTVATIEGGRIESPSYYSVRINDNAKLILGAGVELPDGIFITAPNGAIAENALTIKKGAKIGAYINLNNVSTVTTNCDVNDDGDCMNHTEHVKYIVIEDGEAVEEATFQGIDLGYIQIPDGYHWMKLSDSVENYNWSWKLVKDAAAD